MQLHRKEKSGQLRPFGTSGVSDVAIIDEAPYPVQARGGYTGRLYVWRVDRVGWPLWVDNRDLPSVVKCLGEKGIGLDALDGKRIRERKEQLQARAIEELDEPEEEEEPAEQFEQAANEDDDRQYTEVTDG